MTAHTSPLDPMSPTNPTSPMVPLTSATPTSPPLERTRWERPAFWALLVLTAVLLLWGLGASGYANSFYSAAAQAGAADWKAFLFGSLDSSNAITVDKPPAALWPMALSVRLFGLGAWQILAPQALMGVGAVALLYASVRRWFGPVAGLVAGALFAVTPVAALMFRFNNPDALLCLLMVATVHAVLRALEGGRARWLVLAGVWCGVAFLAKTLQAWLILPVLAPLYLASAPVRPLRRVGHLLLAGLAMVVTAGWWVALVELMPASSRPYVGGSQNDSFLELTFGYNGFGRITGNETGSVGGGGGGQGGPGGGGGGGWGETGLLRMFNETIGGQISWLLPAAALFLVAALVLRGRAPRTDLPRAAAVAWGGSLLVTVVTFSLMSGIFHEYYTVALAPYLAATVAVGAVPLWRTARNATRARPGTYAYGALALAAAGTAVWAYALLARAGDWLPWLRWTVLVAGLVAACGLLVAAVTPARGAFVRRTVAGAALLAVAASVAGPIAFTWSMAASPHAGSIVTAGPASGRGPGGGPGGGPGSPGGPGGGKGAPGSGRGGTPQPPNGGVPPNGAQGQPPQTGAAPGAPTQGGTRPGTKPGNKAATQPGNEPANKPGSKGAAQGNKKGAPRGGGGPSGLLDGQQVSSTAKSRLLSDAEKYTWVAATVGAQNAASYQLATERPVMAIGGFNGSDPSPTLAEFRALVAEGKIHYFAGSSEGGGRGGGPGGGSGTASRITTWVAGHFEKVTVGGSTFYDLTRPS